MNIGIVIAAILISLAIGLLAGVAYRKKIAESKISSAEEEAKKIDGKILIDVNLNESKNVVFIVGPEGGISEKERSFFVSNEFLPISIGNNILRTETASLAFLSMLNYVFMKGN